MNALTVMKSEVFTTVNLKNVRTKFLDFLGGQNRCNDGARCADCLENQDCSAGEVINLFKMETIREPFKNVLADFAR